MKCARCLGWMGIGYFAYLGNRELRICFDCYENLKNSPDPLWSLDDITQRENRLRHDLCLLSRDCICFKSGWTNQTRCCGDESKYGVCMRAARHEGDHMTCSGAENRGHGLATWAWNVDEIDSL